MHYTGPVYRPPFEARSLLLQVTVGCSHNKCAFCTMYREISFSVCPMEEIKADLKEAEPYADRITRVFLENGDPFALSADKLLEIAERVHRYLPKVDAIAMYASIPNLRGKTDEELKALREAGINELNIGVESGLDWALKYLNKGYTAAEAKRELLRLQAADMDYGLNVIFGAGGGSRWRKNAETTAKLLNATQPYLIFTGTIHADRGCPLYDALRSGEFRENTVGEYLEEEELLLSMLEMDRCHYFGLHPSNIVPLQGDLPRDKNAIFDALRQGRSAMSKMFLDSVPTRMSEGTIVRV